MRTEQWPHWHSRAHAASAGACLVKDVEPSHRVAALLEEFQHGCSRACSAYSEILVADDACWRTSADRLAVLHIAGSSTHSADLVLRAGLTSLQIFDCCISLDVMKVLGGPEVLVESHNAGYIHADPQRDIVDVKSLLLTKQGQLLTHTVHDLDHIPHAMPAHQRCTLVPSDGSMSTFG